MITCFDMSRGPHQMTQDSSENVLSLPCDSLLQLAPAQCFPVVPICTKKNFTALTFIIKFIVHYSCVSANLHNELFRVLARI